MRNILAIIGLGLITLSLIVAIIYGGWWVRRQVNYTFLYEGLVKETIQTFVKQECLK